jgi:hypothetical protein
MQERLKRLRVLDTANGVVREAILGLDDGKAST